MSIHVAVTHLTEYRYDRAVSLSPHILCLRPAPHCRTPIEAYSLKVRPTAHFINWQQDAFGNYLARLVFPERTHELSIEVALVADMTGINPFDFFVEGSAELYPFRYEAQLARDLGPYLEIREAGPLLTTWLGRVDGNGRKTIDFLVDLNRRLQHDIRYLIRWEAGVQTCEQTLATRSGSCRDSAWLLVQILRHLGLAARFVSGYLVQLVADVPSLDGPSGPPADFTDLHAWAEVYVPGAGWLGLDPTSGLFAGEGHIPLACTPDPASAAPVRGTSDPAEVEFRYSNRVDRFREDPRVTKPYTEEQWAAIDRVGSALDRELQELDVRLTMGGEPTFVSIDDMDGAEWKTAALGITKRRLAGQLLKRLRERFAPSGALHHGQGKWYPGEELPRWALSCFWRADGQPVWRDPALFADESVNYGFGTDHALRFARTLASRLGIPADLAIPGYEDVFYYLWLEGNLPDDVDPFGADVTNARERTRLMQLLDRGLGTVTGYALPLRWAHAYGRGGRWQGGRWTFRRNRMCLVPGDSAMGYRLPLESLPWLPLDKRHIHPGQSLFEQLPPLADPVGQVARRYSEYLQWPSEVHGVQEQRADESAPETAPGPCSADVRTALCVEPREGRLYVFLPPLIGPTSQAPRVDEARDESLYELEIAFQQMPAGPVDQPWLVDRLLRNLLVDITGNTHRSEFCIDKLYSPDTEQGRLGLVEFRAFEMPPHARMSLVQMLLLRALVARFWETPYRRRPVRWGTELHDRFLLPHYVWEDFRDVVCELRAAGYSLELEWFAPFFEFRFPLCGHVQLRDIHLELRTALEPWNVLGEEVVSRRTARFADSSVERLQVRVSGATDDRHVVTCNGRRVPLRATATRGEFVAGIRYRAWLPPSALHPTIPVHAPLVLDLIDTWSNRSVGGCTYHVAHPGGRKYETLPVNANEAEARRIARFWPYGHTPGPLSAPPEGRNTAFPCTLDLRYREVC